MKNIVEKTMPIYPFCETKMEILILHDPFGGTEASWLCKCSTEELIKGSTIGFALHEVIQ